MGKGICFGVGGKARKVKKLYFGVGGKAKKIKRVYIGDPSGKARLVWQDFVMPTYTGTYVIHGNETKGYIELKSSGTLILSQGIYDVFAVGGGAGGNYQGGGGGSGFTSVKLKMTVNDGSYAVTIGAGGAAGLSSNAMTNGLAGGQSKVVLGSTTILANGGGNGGYTSPSDKSPNFRDGSYGGSGGGSSGDRLSDD